MTGDGAMEQRETYEEVLLAYMDRRMAGIFFSDPGEDKKLWMEELGISCSREELEDEKMFFQHTEETYEKSLLHFVEAGEFLPLLFLGNTFGLDAFEEHVLCLLYALELKPAYAGWLGNYEGYFKGGMATPLLAAATYSGEIRHRELFYAFREEGMLTKYFLEKVPGSRQHMDCGLRLSERVLSFLSGVMLPLESQMPFAFIFSGEEPVERWEGKRSWIEFLEKQLAPGAEPGVIYLYGNEGSGRRLSVKTALKEKGLDGFFLKLSSFLECCAGKREEEFSNMMDRICFELVLLRMVPVILDVSGEDGLEQEYPEGEAKKRDFLERVLASLYKVCPVIVVCADKKQVLDLEGAVYFLPEEKMNLSESLSYWEKQVAEGGFSADFCCDWMAGKFSLTRGQIRQAIRQAGHQAYVCGGGGRGLTMEEVTRECYQVIHHKMGKKAKRVNTRYRMEDLILPGRQKEKLWRAVEQVRYRRKVYEEWGFSETMSYGRGISMAFVGAPGTGKTMAAQVIASELSMELYKVELSGIVSKYIGETEKNLEEIFEQAEKSQVILFFDEADALFSKRSEGKDSNDKYSNMEASFLLQKMETYDGITILATNLFHHFDEAYKRRLKLVVDFPVPQEEDRRRLWHSMLPAGLPCGEIDFDFLASHYELTGSNIRNILLYAAFLAAAKGKAMDMEEIIPALANEYGKNGKVFTREDASEYFLYL